MPLLRTFLQPVVVTSPDSATPCILGSLVNAAGVYATSHISNHSLFKWFWWRFMISNLLKQHVFYTSKGSKHPLHVRDSSWSWRSRCNYKLSQKYSLDIPFPYWELVITVSHPPPLQAYSRYLLPFQLTVAFKSASYLNPYPNSSTAFPYSLPHLSGVWPDIYCLLVDQVGTENPII